MASDLIDDAVDDRPDIIAAIAAHPADPSRGPPSPGRLIVSFGYRDRRDRSEEVVEKGQSIRWFRIGRQRRPFANNDPEMRGASPHKRPSPDPQLGSNQIKLVPRLTLPFLNLNKLFLIIQFVVKLFR
jgi:hypothetical protein